MKKSPILPLLLCVTVLLGTTFGCAGRSPATYYYVLDSQQQVMDTAAHTKVSLQLRRVDIPSYLDRNSIVTRSKNTVQVKVSDYHYWAESLSSGMQRTLSEVLAPRMAAQGVSLAPLDDHSTGPLQIFVQVLRFDGVFEADAILEARWTLRTASDKIVAQGSFMEQLPVGTSYESLVQAQSALLVRFGEALVTPLVEASLTYTEQE